MLHIHVLLGQLPVPVLAVLLEIFIVFAYVLVLSYIQFDANKMLMMMDARVWQRAACRTRGMQFNSVTTYQQASL